MGFLGRNSGSNHFDINITRGIIDTQREKFLPSPPLFDPSEYMPALPKPLDPYCFYPVDTTATEQGSGVGFVCAEFRHQLDPEYFTLRLAFRCSEATGINGAIQVRLSARNMPQLFEKTFPVRVRIVDADMERIAAGLLP